jgi:pre-mRNA-splicing factor SYF1
VEQVIRAGIRRFTDEVGRLWHALADYFIRLGQFEKARDVYEEAISSVLTVRDFSIAFDAYALYQDSMLTAKIQLRGEEGEGEGEAKGDDGDDLRELDDDADDVDLLLARLEALIESRPVLLSSVMLRQNPHNVHEWLKRAKVRVVRMCHV